MEFVATVVFAIARYDFVYVHDKNIYNVGQQLYGVDRAKAKASFKPLANKTFPGGA